MTDRRQTRSSPPSSAPAKHALPDMLKGNRTSRGASSVSAELPEKQRNQMALQRSSKGEMLVAGVPSIVHRALHSPGQPLDSTTRAFFEPRFGHDFGNVRVHADPQANESARAVNALAYTVGSHIVFDVTQYTPSTHQGRSLLAHELTHVVQQRGIPYSVGAELEIGGPDDSTEREAADVAKTVGGQPVGQSAPLGIQRAADEFPGFSQGDAVTCGAASLVSALMIWGRERKSPTAPNDMVVTAANIILTHMDDHKNALIQSMTARKEKIAYDTLFTELTRIRDDARKPGAKIPEVDYQLISDILVILFRSASSGGLSKGEIEGIQRKLGLSTGVQSATQAQTFSGLFADPVLTGLKPGQIAQVFWYQQDKQGNPIVDPVHVFLVGRFQRGAWFISDQGSRPPTELEAATPNGLKIALLGEMQTGRAAIFTGAKPFLLPAPFTGVVLLGERGGVEKAAEAIILTPGTFLAEVDATTICCGEKLAAWDFIDRKYSFSDAESAFNSSGSGHGGLIVENPVGLFHIFKTNPLKDKDNLKATSIDESDSSGGYLMQKSRYYHAWLKLCLATSCNPSFFQVR